MYYIRYCLTFVCEWVSSWRTRSSIQAVGCRAGSIRALFSWCHEGARFSALHKHPLYYCVNRKAWIEWMQQG